MTLFYFDDTDTDVIAYSATWITYVGATGAVNATAWFDGTFHSCRADQISGSTGCNATISFTGSGITVVGDHNPNQRVFYCSLDGGEYHWKNGSLLAAGNSDIPTSLNHTRCKVEGLENKQHTLLFGQTTADVNANGITLDYVVVDNSTSSATNATWSSDFQPALADAGWAWSTQTASASSASITSSAATSTSAAATSSASSSASSSSGSSSGTSVGVGVGVGLGVSAGLALLGGWYFWKRRRRVPSSVGTMQTEPMGQRSVAGDSPYSPSSPQGVVPYLPHNTTYGGAPSEYGRQSAYFATVPEVQEHHQPSVTPYYSPSSLQSSQVLDNPSTFRPR
ncbi:hypothetical protein JCM1840_002733 [Sporobolomyces johnsonii]